MVALSLGAFVLSAPASAQQDYPVRPVTLIVPWPAGGPTDGALRAIAESASKHLGQPILVENKAGGTGTVGPATMAATAKPDGYTISQIPASVFQLPIMQDATWDPLKDFTYVINLTGYVFATFASEPVRLQDVEGCRRLRQGQPRQSDVRNAGRGQPAACRYGADGGEGRRQVHARAFQGRR